MALKGFGEKTQKSIGEAIGYFQESQGKLLFRDAEKICLQFQELWNKNNVSECLVQIGDVAMKRQVVESNQFACNCDPIWPASLKENKECIELLEENEEEHIYLLNEHHRIQLSILTPDEFVRESFILRSNEDFADEVLSLIGEGFIESEDDIFDLANLNYIPAECREYRTIGFLRIDR